MESREVMPPREALPRYVWGRGGLVRLRMLTANRTAEVGLFSFSLGEGLEVDGLRARVMWCQKNAEMASLVENASAAVFRSSGLQVCEVCKGEVE
jgi:hypothetical protein